MATLRSVPETRPTSAALSNTLGTDGLAYHLDDNLAPGAPTSYSKVCQRLSAERIQPVAELLRDPFFDAPAAAIRAIRHSSDRSPLGLPRRAT